MRIISPFKDYYDGVMAMDQDRSLIYDRKPVEVKYTKKGYPFPICDWVYYRQDIDFHQRIIGFCGRIYPALLLRLESHYFDDPWTLCESIEDIDRYVEANFDEDYREKYIGKRKYYRNNPLRLGLKQWFDEVSARRDSYRETIFEPKQCPVFVAYASRNELTVDYNGSLKDTGFVKKFDPYQAYQEISMFLGGLAVPQKPMPKIDDVTMAEIKGFDKRSFRKDPQP